MEGLKLIIDNQISGYCPSCPAPDLYFSYKSGGGKEGSYDEMRYTVSCTHMKVCKYRDRAKTAKAVSECSGNY